MKKTGRPRSNLIGQKFGRLTVKGIDTEKTGDRWLWICRCDCGATTKASTGSLRCGTTTSCGCWKLEELSLRATTKSYRDTAEYKTWMGMRARCNIPSATNYGDYGGRGIKVCDRWNDFFAFLSDMGPRPHNHSIERNDVNGDYCPENCRWATKSEQANNTRVNRLITVDGVTKSVRQWEDHMGYREGTISTRLRHGWSESDAVTRKPAPGGWGVSRFAALSLVAGRS